MVAWPSWVGNCSSYGKIATNDLLYADLKCLLYNQEGFHFYHLQNHSFTFKLIKTIHFRFSFPIEAILWYTLLCSALIHGILFIYSGNMIQRFLPPVWLFSADKWCVRTYRNQNNSTSLALWSIGWYGNVDNSSVNFELFQFPKRSAQLMQMEWGWVWPFTPS